ncbi:MAG: DUF61 family protein [Methanobacteriota archaeon]|nr:MAG: DUF61 family protein [Euryarchaeota archaeon]
MWGEPGSVDRWVERESRNLNASLVTAKKSLETLLREERPSCRTRDGEEWPIDREGLERLAAACDPGEAEALRLPLAVHFSSDLSDACYITDGIAATVLRRAEGFGPAYPFREGRMYLPLSLGVDLVSRYKGAIQQVFL